MTAKETIYKIINDDENLKTIRLNTKTNKIELNGENILSIDYDDILEVCKTDSPDTKFTKQIVKEIVFKYAREHKYESPKVVHNENNIHGNWSLRRRYFHSKPIWESIIQNIFDKLKDTINLIYKEQKHNTKYVDSKKLNMLINDLKYTEKQFKKNTDNCSVYPIKSETIKDNLLYIIAYLENY